MLGLRNGLPYKFRQNPSSLQQSLPLLAYVNIFYLTGAISGAVATLGDASYPWCGRCSDGHPAEAGSVCHGSDDATYHRAGHHSCGHLTGIALMYMHYGGGVHGTGRHGFAEEVIGIVVAVIVDPGATYAVAPPSVPVIPHAAFPPGDIASAPYTVRRSAADHPAATGHGLRAVLWAWAVTIAGVVTRVVLVVAMALSRSAAVIVAVVATVLAVAHLRALPVAFRSPALCRGIHTGQ